LAGFEKQVEGLEFRRMFSGEMDANHAFLDIQSGSGGTEAQDWAKQKPRQRMYDGDCPNQKVIFAPVDAHLFRYVANRMHNHLQT
jgi:peptide chain release factor 2